MLRRLFQKKTHNFQSRPTIFQLRAASVVIVYIRLADQLPLETRDGVAGAYGAVAHNYSNTIIQGSHSW